jgi:hypothetical protein
MAQSVQRLGYGLDDQGSIPGRGKMLYGSVHTSPPGLLSNGYRL